MIEQNNFIHTQQEKQGYPCTWYEVAVDMGEKFGTESIYSHENIEACKKWAKANLQSIKTKVNTEYNVDCCLFCDLWEQKSDHHLPLPKMSIFTENDILEGHI